MSDMFRTNISYIFTVNIDIVYKRESNNKHSGSLERF